MSTRRDEIVRGLLDVFFAVRDERLRQEEFHPGDTCWELGKPDREKWAVFASEVQEVWDALFNDEPVEHLRAELIQVAAVAAAWVQALDRAEANQ